MKKDILNATLLWIVLSILGWILVLNWNIFPPALAREARIVDDAFNLLTVLAVPVFTFVVAILIYAAFRFRSPGGVEDGPPIQDSGRILTAWLIVTIALAGGILINPGFVGMSEVRGEGGADVVIGVTGQRWSWTISYPNGVDVTSYTGELVLPVDQRIQFDITSLDPDVIHSFWIPAFRIKKDAVPGRITQMFITPTETGTFAEDPNVRVQCAELCGQGHAQMSMKVRVVEQAEFDAYLDEILAEGG
ncbi:Cytochrome c oxidase polypeptide II [hydrothermal vent metagenome]|uniref:cytochrome-c oxidase n=1 Tax=hydrothermal vent metagenome TaxID=652676 RepID=A0A3B0SAZ4_9ZZZZ